MGDGVPIPRTFAGSLGVADVTNAIKRKFLTVPITDTTARFLGNSSTGGFKFARNAQIEKVIAIYHTAGTTSNSKQFGLSVWKNASTVIATILNGSAVSPWGTTGWKREEPLPKSAALASFTSNDRLTLNLTNRTDGTTRISVVVQYLEDEDA